MDLFTGIMKSSLFFGSGSSPNISLPTSSVVSFSSWQRIKSWIQGLGRCQRTSIGSPNLGDVVSEYIILILRNERFRRIWLEMLLVRSHIQLDLQRAWQKSSNVTVRCLNHTAFKKIHYFVHAIFKRETYSPIDKSQQHDNRSLARAIQCRNLSMN